MGKKRTHKEFIKELSIIQPKLIAIGKYKGSFDKILVKDENNIEYLCQPVNLLAGQKPSIRLAVDKNKCFKIKAKLIHNNTYNYDNVEYLKNYTKVIISCKIHGNFSQTPSDHLKGCGCKQCFINSEIISFNEFVNRATLKYKGKYSYLKSKAKYKSLSSKLIITCPIHGDFIQSAAGHLIGSGCLKCIKRLDWYRSTWIEFCDSNPNSSPKTYIIKCFNDNEEFIKIGITSKLIHQRFKKSNLPYSYEILKEIKGSPDFVWDKEKELHRLCKNFKHKPLLEFGGQTECFTLEALKLLE